MEAPVVDQSINMEDLGPPSPPKFPAELRCSQIKSVQMEMRIFTARKKYVSELLEIEKESNGPMSETAQKSEEEMTSLDEKINILEGKMLELLPCPIALCSHNSKNKAVKRTAEPVIRPAKFTAKATNNKSNNSENSKNINSKNKNEVTDFVFPKKTSKIVPVKELEQLKTTNAFAALNTATVDAEDVSPPKPKIKPIFMRITNSYSLILQDLHRAYPTATNTHMRGYIKIEAQSTDDHRNITNYLKAKELEHYVIDPPSTRPLKLVIKGLPDNIDPDDIKTDLVSKGIKITKIAQLKKFVTKTPLPLYMIEIERDENVNDIYQVRSCLYMQIKLDPFRKSNRITQCYNCNYFHHASQNCSMKTRCLKCGGNHKTGACEIKEKIENPLCINCNTRGHMASSTTCPQFPKPKKGKGKSPFENLKRNIASNPVIPGISYAQILNPNSKQQMAAPGNASSASNITENNKNEQINLEALNATQSETDEFGFLQAILEMQKIFTLFPSLLSEMKKSFNCTNPADKLNCLLKGVCSSLNNLTVNNV
ncbi:nucleic-acid-binding protein from transposon X-element [Trichonephila clavipes]|nr:nucleic-acid-binding protein from transposon X-element [Trichonephila clavipes]